MKLPTEDHTKLRIWAIQNGKTLQDILAEAVRNWMKENLKDTEVKVGK